MTVLTKPSAIIKKPEITNTPLVEKGVNDEEKIEIHSGDFPKRSSKGMVCLSVMAFVLAIVGFSTGLVLCKHMLRTNNRRYQGFCSIVIPNDIRELESNHVEPHFRVLPLQWSHDVEVITTGDEDSSDEFVNALREELDIGDMVEKISVLNNGHRVDFVHDFNDNTTSIIDISRCFVMDLAPALVLTPLELAEELQRGAAFDVSRVRTDLRAALSPAGDRGAALSSAGARCVSRPVYRLYSDEGPLVRKRSVDEPPHDYVQFAGRHVQEIRIGNLAEIIESERASR